MSWLVTPKGQRPVKKLLPNSYDRSKEIVLIGKGPSCRYIRSNNSMYTCCLNTSGRMTDRIDFQFIGDLYIYKQFLKIPKYFDKISNIIIPLRFNLENKGEILAYELIKDTLPEHINVYSFTFNFHPYPETENVRMYSVISSGETAVAWLLDEGFKNFKTTGIDPHAPDNVRHSVFEQNNEGNWLHPNAPGGMKISYDRSVYRVKQFEGSFEKVNNNEYL
jgi:hypothetical protein